MTATPDQIFEALDQALCRSLNWTRDRKDISNSLRSARFLSDSCKELSHAVNPNGTLNARFIAIEDKCGERCPGEWLLDGIWTEDIDLSVGHTHNEPAKVPIRVGCALECESSTNGRELLKDFSKLLVVSSPLKIFAAGLNQRTPDGVDEYIRNRITTIEELLGASSKEASESDWYIAFWPSPLNIDGGSLWKRLDARFSHLNKIRLFYRLNSQPGAFIEYLPMRRAL